MVGLNITATLDKVFTHEGAVAAAHDSARAQLLRTVASTPLWEPQYYEGGDKIAARIVQLVQEVKDDAVAEIAVTARTRLKLRQVPLWVTAAGLEAPSGTSSG
jgi:60 kDa SS-A/Ro ribonucleoprotein